MITIVGCDHIYQRKGQRCFGDERLLAFEADQKRRFIEVIAEQQQREHATLVCEEIDYGCETFAKDLAEPPVRYVNVDTPVPEREARGIPIGYANPGTIYTREQVDGWHAEREQDMVRRTLAELTNLSEPTLLVCGRTHQERLATGFRAQGIECNVIDLADYEWFSDTWELDY